MARKSGSTKERAAESTAPATTNGTAAERAGLPDPFGQFPFAGWFERWPDIVTSRWPKAFEGMPFTEGGFRMEQFRDGDMLVVRGELPGLDPDEDLTITVDDDMLTIAGERSETSKDEGDNGYRSEFHYGSFRRSVRLPRGVDAEKITADYTDGILEVRVPVDSDQSGVVSVPVSRTG